MKTNLKSIGVACALFIYTAIISVRCIYNYYLGRLTRTKTNAIVHQWVDQLLNAVKVNYKIVNPFNTQPELGKATILVCNHSSVFDIPLAFKAFPDISLRMLAKKELSRIPLMGKAMATAEFPFIDRKKRYQAIKDLAYVKELMQSGIVMWVAPEGTRSKDGKLAAFKKGAFITAIESQATIIPVGIRGAHNIVAAQSFKVRLQQKAEIHIGEPIDASQYNLENKDELIERTHRAMKELLGE